MNSRIKNVKTFVTLFVAMFFCGSMLAQQNVDLHFSNVHVDGSNLRFTIKMKTGANYGINGLRIATSNIFIDVVDQYGTPAIYFNPSQMIVQELPDNPVFNNLAFKVMTSSGKDYRLGLTLTKGGFNNPPYTIDDEYMVVANYIVPYVAATSNPSVALLKITSLTESDGDYTRWNGLEPGGANVQNQPYNATKPGGYPVESSCPAQALWTGALDTDWFDSENWVNPSDGSPAGIPCATTKVFIPGSGYRGNGLGPVVPIHLPSLTSAATCDEITFFQGGQVGRIDRLTYNKARVQLNFPSGSSSQGSQYYDGSDESYYKFSKGYSSPELSAGQWHMLSIPLQGVVSGDLGYGGFPMTFMRKFNINNDDEMENYVSGDWTESYKSTIEPLGRAEGFAFYMYPQGTSFGTVYSADNNKNVTGATGYGLGKTSGIIEFPTYDNAYKLNSHRIQSYSAGSSIFYDVETGGAVFDLGDILDGSDPVARSNNDYKLNTAYFNSESYAALNREVLVGNPFMSVLDFSGFYTYNSGGPTPRITNAYRIWNGTTFIDYNCVSETATSGAFTTYIPPMQSFFVTGTRPSGSFIFDPEDMSVIAPKTENVYLRSAQETEEQNIIRLSAINQYATTSAVIAQSREAVIEYKEGEDITKLFSPSGSHSYVSEIYSLAGETALSMNYIGEAGAIVPIGIRVPASGSTTLKLTGMNNYDANRIELIDGKTNMMIADITNLQEYEYSFDNKEGGYQSGRFYLRITESTTGTGNIKNQGGIQVYKSGEAIHVLSSPDNLIKQIRIYDVQGRILYSDTDVATDIYRITEQFDKKQVLVVQVTTENNTKSVKINN